MRTHANTHLRVIVLVSGLETLHISRDRALAPLLLPVIDWTVEAVGEVVRSVTLVVKVHEPISLVVLDSCSLCPVRAVDRQLGVVGAQPVQVSVMVREQTTLEGERE